MQETNNETLNNITEEHSELPEPLRNRLIKQYLGAAFVGILTIICTVVLDDFGCLIGFFFSGFLVWIGRDIIARWNKGKIVCKRVVCQKVKRNPLRRSKTSVIFKDCTVNVNDGSNLYKFQIPTSKQTTGMLFEGCVVDIYIDTANVAELVAWHLIDVAQ